MASVHSNNQDRKVQAEPSVNAINSSTFAGEALKLSGKSADEVERMGAIDAADDHVEALFAERYQTANSPIHKAVWNGTVPIELFDLSESNVSAQWHRTIGKTKRVMEDSLALVRSHKLQGTFLDQHGKITDEVMTQLGDVGYWGLLIDNKYGGSGASFVQFASFLTRMAMVDPTIAGLASVHGCIGAVDPLVAFGSEEQKERLLPLLASGRRLSAFALTEPNAGSDMTALRTSAYLDGNEYVLSGRKLFITNVKPGRMIGVVCLIAGRPAVLIVDLPDVENENFQLKKYGLYALKQAYNQGIVFNNLRVPRENLLVPSDGDGLTIAYHGLNRGRIALAANAAGTMRVMMADMLPWARFRRTYGEAIAKRELVQRRVGELAGLIVACDSLSHWCAALLDLGFRGEMECVIAKIFASEAQKHASIELYMKTIGGRSFLHGNMFGDNVHEFLAPCIYEGEGEMLGLAFFKSLVKHHGRSYFEPIGKALQAARIKQPNLSHPAHLWALRKPLTAYAGWWFHRSMPRRSFTSLPKMDDHLRRHALFASKFLSRAAFEVSGMMRKHQLKLADRQCRMAELSWRIQTAVVILCTSLHCSHRGDPLVLRAADVLCTQLTNSLLGRRASDHDLRVVTKLGSDIADSGFDGLDQIEPQPIMMPYSQN